MSNKDNKNMYLIHCAIMIAIAFLFRLLPCPGTVTPYGMSILGVFFAMVYGWCFIDLLVPMFSTMALQMMLLGSLAFATVEFTGAGDWMIAKLLGSKFAKRSAISVVMIFFIIFYVANVIGLVWFTYFALFPLVAKTLLKCGYEKGDKFNILFLTGCLLIGGFGLILFPFLQSGVMMSGTITAATGAALDDAGYMTMNIVLAIVLIVTYPILMKVLGCDFSKLANIDIEEQFASAIKAGNGKLTKAQSLALGSIVVFIVVVVLASFFGSKIAILGWLNTNYGVLGLMFLLLLFGVAVKVDGKPLLDMKKAAASFSWDIFFLMGMAMMVSNALVAQETGISAFVAGILTPIFANVHPVVFIIVIGGLSILLTNVANNIAIAFVMLNIAAAMYNAGFPVNITALTYIVASGALCTGVLTPAASVNGVLLHASEANTASGMYKYVPIVLIYSWICMSLVAIPYVLMTS